MTRKRWLLLAPATAFVVALAAVALVQVRRHGDAALGGNGTGELALQLSAGLGLWVAGVGIGLRRSDWLPGLLMAASGAAVFLAELPLPDSGGALLFTMALLGGSASAALAGAAALFYAPPLRWRPDGAVATVALVAVVPWMGVLGTVTFDPRREGCFACPRNLLLVYASPRAHEDAVRLGLYAAAASCFALASLILVRWLRRPRPVRLIAAPVQLGAAVAVAAATVAFAHEARLGIVIHDRQTHVLWLVECLALCVVAAGAGVEIVRARLLSHRIAGIVIDAMPSSEALRSTLAASVGDTTLSVAFPRGDGSAIDSDGRLVELQTPGPEVTEVMRGGEVVAYLRHASDLGGTSERLAEAARGAGLALEHASSRARLRAQLAELQTSRARIVEIGDGERRRLERNLHDGAQQRLIALSVALQPTPEGGTVNGRAREEILTALDELRSLAHGIHPASLTDAGLDAAVRELAESSRVPLQIESVPRERFSAAVESAAYRVVLDAVRCAERAGDGRSVSVSIERMPEALRVRLGLPGVDVDVAAHELEHAIDRVNALDGAASLALEGDNTRISATVPCGS